MDKTTIQITTRTKDLLDERKLSDESYDAALSRILDNDTKLMWDEQEIREIARIEAEKRVEDMAHR
jgi:hypothetical protein